MTINARQATARWRARLLFPVLALVLCPACDPPGPGAMGQLTVTSEASTGDGRTLEMRAFPDDGQRFAVATADLHDRVNLQRESLPVAEIEFPFEYWIGAGIGTTDTESWRLVAWIAESENAERPRAGEWYGTRLFSVAECPFPFGGYCSVTPDIEIEINSRMQ